MQAAASTSTSTSTPPQVHEIGPGEGYDMDSDAYDSQEELEELAPAEYDQLVDEAENGYTQDELQAMITDLKERGLVTFLRDYLKSDSNGDRASLRKLVLGLGAVPPVSLRHPSTPDLALLPFTRLVLARILRRRAKLPQYNTLDDAVHLLGKAQNVIVLSGAGISTSCGIPDFRSSDGLYAQLQQEGKYDLDDPTQMFDIAYFRECPSVFYSFAKQIYPSNFTPSPCHRWIKMLEDKGTLLRNYTQNIDTLESQAGVTKVLQCHGSFKTASCLRCKRRVPGSEIEPFIMSQTVAACPVCQHAREEELARLAAIKDAKRQSKTKAKGKGRAHGWGSGSDSDSDTEEDGWGGGEPGLMKPDITFFGQALDSQFDECLWRDREKVDLLVIIGTSLKVAPVSEVLAHIPHSVPQIYINRAPITHVQPDICLHGDADAIVSDLSARLGWTIPPPSTPVSGGQGTEDVKPTEPIWRSGVGEMSHLHFFESSATDQPSEVLDSDDKEGSVSSVESGLEHIHVTATSSEERIAPTEAKIGHGYDGNEDEDEGDRDEHSRPAKRIKA